ncbi:MAG: hypothetical protein M3P83_10905 [Actinomycetota bacterium]|nr:hypothetical protein [Actinomycetota bacterium]
MTAPASPPVVYLHIGTPKSGTSYLQALLSANKEALASQGVLWPGATWGAQVAAVRDLRGLRAKRGLRRNGAWMRLARQVTGWTGNRAVVSMEWLVNLRPHQITAAVDSLRPCRVEVVCTARDLVRTVPAAWQEAMQNGRTWSWEEFLTEVTDDDPPSTAAGRGFWIGQDVPALARRWSTAVPMERFHVVTVPPAGADPTLLWSRVGTLLGLDPTVFRQPQRSNESLGAVSAQLMWLVNQRTAELELQRRSYRPLLKRNLAKSVLVTRKGREGRLVLPPHAHGWATGRASDMVQELKNLPVDVVGDLQDLLPDPTPQTGEDPGTVPDAELLDAAVDGLAGLAAIESRSRQRAEDEMRRLRRQVRQLRRRHTPTEASAAAVEGSRLPRSVRQRTAAVRVGVRGALRRARSRGGSDPRRSSSE